MDVWLQACVCVCVCTRKCVCVRVCVWQEQMIKWLYYTYLTCMNTWLSVQIHPCAYKHLSLTHDICVNVYNSSKNLCYPQRKVGGGRAPSMFLQSALFKPFINLLTLNTLLVARLIGASKYSYACCLHQLNTEALWHCEYVFTMSKQWPNAWISVIHSLHLHPSPTLPCGNQFWRQHCTI